MTSMKAPPVSGLNCILVASRNQVISHLEWSDNFLENAGRFGIRLCGCKDSCVLGTRNCHTVSCARALGVAFNPTPSTLLLRCDIRSRASVESEYETCNIGDHSASCSHLKDQQGPEQSTLSCCLLEMIGLAYTMSSRVSFEAILLAAVRQESRRLISSIHCLSNLLRHGFVADGRTAVPLYRAAPPERIISYRKCDIGASCFNADPAKGPARRLSECRDLRQRFLTACVWTQNVH